MNPLRADAFALLLSCAALPAVLGAADPLSPLDPNATERENSFEFTEKPRCANRGNDRYEISFAVKAPCDVTVAILDPQGAVVRHLGAGVLGANAPLPFQKNALRQTLAWDGKDDLGAYVREPEKMRAKVMLGLKPVFERLLGGTSPYNLPGKVLGFAADPEGVYVFSRGRNVYLRKFGHDGRYLQCLAPPSPALPEARLGGRTSIEYEPGKRAHHGAYLMQDLGYNGNFFPGLDDDYIGSLQSVVVGGRIYYCNGGASMHIKSPPTLYYLYSDGGTDVPGSAGRAWINWQTRHELPRFAASPDGRWLYFAGLGGAGSPSPGVLRIPVAGDGPGEPFLGKREQQGKGVQFVPASDNTGFNNPTGLDTDAQGRLYVADSLNHRIQIFSPEGKYLQTLRVGGAALVQVHKKTGALYVLHSGEVSGRSVGRLTKFTSFEKPAEEFHLDFVHARSFLLDSWSERPRLWLNGLVRDFGQYERPPEPNNVLILEEQAGKLTSVLDFNAAAVKEADSNWIGRWSGGVFDHVDCDPLREQLYYQAFRADPWVFDLASGRKVHRLHMPGPVNDVSFDKRGYLHAHLDPGFYLPGVGRLDASQPAPFRDHLGQVHPGVVALREVPYDYGIELEAPQKPGWKGGLPVKDQPGAKFFQDGFGVNMKGELAVESNIYYIPKMSEESFEAAFNGPRTRVQRGGAWFCDSDPYQGFLKQIQERLKHGEEIYSIRRIPGVPLAGGTIWTFDSSGEIREECAVIAHKLVIGSRIDEDGNLYFINSRARVRDGKPFLALCGKNLGTDKLIYPHNNTPITYTHMKTNPKNVRWLLPDATIPLEPKPAEPTVLTPFGPFGAPELGAACWVQGVQWMYAGVSPAVPDGCTCPATRPHLDWYKRSYVPEAYRRSLGILDTAGNLILHLGQYGNFDDALRMKPGAAEIAVNLPRFVGGTDNYLCFDDWGERLVQLKLEYHASETVSVTGK